MSGPHHRQPRFKCSRARAFLKEVDPGAVTTGGGTVTIDVPLRITISLGQPGTATVVASHGIRRAAGFDRKPARAFRDTDFSSRTGYDPNFLNAPGQDPSLTAVRVPLPAPADPAVLAKAKDGTTLLNYENFSIAMHAQRRLALFTASNVTKEPYLRKPDPTGDYTAGLERAWTERPGTLVSRPSARRQIPASRCVLHQGPRRLRQGPYRPPRRCRLGPHLSISGAPMATPIT